MKKGNESQGVKTTDTIFGIIEEIRRSNGATVTEVAEKLDLAPSTVYAHLSTLESMKYLVKEEGMYHIGLQFLYHGTHARNRLPVAQVARPALSELADTTEELVWLVVEEHGRGVFLQRETGAKAISVRARPGTRGYLHYLATGKAILAEFSDVKVRDIIDMHGLPSATGNTITDEKELFKELEMIRKNGYAFMNGEIIKGLSGIAASIVHEGTVHGAVSVTGPENRLSRDYLKEEILNDLLNATNEIELRLKRP